MRHLRLCFELSHMRAHPLDALGRLCGLLSYWNHCGREWSGVWPRHLSGLLLGLCHLHWLSEQLRNLLLWNEPDDPLRWFGLLCSEVPLFLPA